MEVKMPYIKNEERVPLMPSLTAVCLEIQKQCSPGELNYMITTLCRSYLISKGKNYTHINDIMGVLLNVILEFNRRVTVDYENSKIEENGDVY
jgi:hypothetical protein